MCHSKQDTRVKKEECRSVSIFGAASRGGKTPGVAWTAADDKVLYRHTKNVCVVTLFEDEGDIFRVVETPGMSKDGKCCYVDHFRFPDVVPPERH